MSYTHPLQVSLVIDPYGSPAIYPLTSSQNGWYVRDDATGMAPLHLITERGPLQHGSTYLDFRLNDRTIVLIVQILGATERDYQEHRTNLLRLFAPRESAMALRWALQDGTVRQIDGRPNGGLTLPRSLIEQRLVSGGQGQSEAVEFHCFDPTFYDPEQRGVNFELSAWQAGMAVPTPVPTIIGTSLDQTTVVNYQGTWRTFPVIIITGPITDPIITNETTGETLDFTDTTIASGEVWTIDLRYGYKTITDQDGTNQIAALSDASDLATWHLKPIDLDLTGQANSIRVTGQATDETTNVGILYYERYVGM